MKWLFSAWILILTSLLASVPASAMPAGWQQINTGGATLCARGEAYSFFVRPGDPQKILIDFGGGGACWDSLTCDNDQIFKDTVMDTAAKIAGQSGIYDPYASGNPYRGWTHVVIPYCTGDLHLGGADAVYTRYNRSTFTIHHRGAINVRAVMDWVQSQYADPQDVSVAGCSAGSYASIVWTAYLAERYKGTRLFQFGDSGAGVADRIFFPQWGMHNSIPSWIPSLNPARVDWNTISLAQVYKGIAEFYPLAQFSQFNHERDRVQKFFFAALGGDTEQWKEKMFSSMDEISASNNFRFFIAPGPNHCALSRSALYVTSSDGVRLSDWLHRGVQRHRVENVRCLECSSQK